MQSVSSGIDGSLHVRVSSVILGTLDDLPSRSVEMDPDNGEASVDPDEFLN